MPLSEVARDIFLVPLPLPFALRSVNCYLLRDGDGWAVIDSGLHTEASEAGWRAAFAELGMAPQAISRIVLTHHHPDHFGMAGWLQALSGAPVLIAPREVELAASSWGQPPGAPEPMAALFAAHGTPALVNATIVETMAALRAATLPLPMLTPLLPGAALELGGRRLTAIHAPGHSDGQLLLYDEADGLLFSGDQVLMQITPHIGVWPSSEPNPLGRYLASLAQLERLPVRLALPGHRAPISAWSDRIAQLRRHHEERLATMLAVVGAGATAYAVAERVFPFERYTPHEMRFAVAETIAHLDLLAARGLVWREEQEEIRYVRG